MMDVLVLASGGLDSSVTIKLYESLGYNVTALYIDYGNKNSKAEFAKLKKLCFSSDIAFIEQKADFQYSHSVCLKGKYDSETMYVEMRNLVFLSTAVSLAQTLKVEHVAIGIIGASTSYCDCSPQFIEDFATMTLNATGIKVHAPLINLDKYEVYRFGKKLGLSLKDTFSCNMSEGDKPCGKCPDCSDIMRIIEREGVPNEDNPFL